MRFKTIFWIFNIVVVLALALVSATSFFILERSFMVQFWRHIWFLLLIFIFMIIVLNVYFIRHWKLFSFLEKEDWPGLLAWLEERLYEKGRLNRSYANLLVNTALSVSNFDAVRKLETEIRQRKPKLMNSLGVALGIPTLLQGSPSDIVACFAPLANNPQTKRRDWALWCKAQASRENSIDDLFFLLGEKDISLRLLSFHILSQNQSELNEEQHQKLETMGETLKNCLKGVSGERSLQHSRNNHLMAIVLSSRVDEIRKKLLKESL